MKRLSIQLEDKLKNTFKSISAMRGEQITDLIRLFAQAYSYHPEETLKFINKLNKDLCQKTEPNK